MPQMTLDSDQVRNRVALSGMQMTPGSRSILVKRNFSSRFISDLTNFTMEYACVEGICQSYTLVAWLLWLLFSSKVATETNE